MYLERNELPKAFLANCFVVFTYYQICSRYKLLTKEALESQLSFYAISSISYNALQTKWGSNQSFHKIDIVPIALLLISKVEKTSWKTHTLCIVVLSGSQITTAKLLSWKEPPAQLISKEVKWLSNYDLIDYQAHLSDRHPECQFIIPYCNKLQNLRDHLFYLMNQYEKNVIFIPLHVTKNHWTLIYVNRTKRSVEYYDSKDCYGNYVEITRELQEFANGYGDDPDHPPYTFESKIKKKLQPDSYQCGVWVLYFIEKLAEDPDVDFNELDIDRAQKMIANFRKHVIPFFDQEGWG